MKQTQRKFIVLLTTSRSPRRKERSAYCIYTHMHAGRWSANRSIYVGLYAYTYLCWLSWCAWSRRSRRWNCCEKKEEALVAVLVVYVHLTYLRSLGYSLRKDLQDKEERSLLHHTRFSLLLRRYLAWQGNLEIQLLHTKIYFLASNTHGKKYIQHDNNMHRGRNKLSDLRYLKDEDTDK